MTGASPDGNGLRVLVLAPTGKDAALTETILERAGMNSVRCNNLEAVCNALAEGAGAVLLAEEAVAKAGTERLARWIADQPSWSDLPILVLARPGADSAEVARAMDHLGNVTVLERPTRVAALVSAVRTALRGRGRQYEAREHLEALREADRRKDEFLAILAHELRNPLAPMRNALHILRLTGQEDPTVKRVCEMMERQVDNMVRLVDELLEVSRITRGKIELHREPVDVTAIVNSAVETSRPLIDAAGHRLEVSLPPTSLILEGDPFRLAQVLSNLLNNAAKYTEPDGLIVLSAWRDGDTIAISVRDTGVGIAADQLPRVFQLFTQVEGHADRAQGGLGIGLTLVKRLVELHGGSITAHSEGAGKGSEFVIRIPVASEAGNVARPLERAAESAFAQRRFMVVDDNFDAASSLGMLLKMMGADVRVAHSGRDALGILPAYKPHAVLLDIGMPGMDGHEVARRIRQQPELAGVALIALTGWGQEEDRRRSEAAGFDYHLTKPADVETIMSLLHSLDERPGRHPVR